MRRTQKQSIPSWVAAYLDVAPFRRAVSRLGDRSDRISEICSKEGLVTRDMISRCAGRYTKRAKCLAAWRQHNEGAICAPHHLMEPAGVRAACVLCGELSPMSHVLQWARRPCQVDVGGRTSRVQFIQSHMTKLERELQEDAALLRAAALRLSRESEAP